MKRYSASNLPLPLHFIAIFGVLSVIAAGQGYPESAKQFALIGLLVLAGRFLSDSGVSVTLLIGLVAVVFSTALLSSCPSCNSGGIWGWMAFAVTAINIILLALGSGIWLKAVYILASITILAEVMLGISTDKFCISCVFAATFQGLILWVPLPQAPCNRLILGGVTASAALPIILFPFAKQNHLEMASLRGVSFSLISRTRVQPGKRIAVFAHSGCDACHRLKTDFDQRQLKATYLEGCASAQELNCFNLHYMPGDVIYPTTFLIQDDKILERINGYSKSDVDQVEKWLKD